MKRRRLTAASAAASWCEKLRALTSTNTVRSPRWAMRSISPAGVFTRRATMRKPLSRRNSAAQASPRRPAPSAKRLDASGLVLRFAGEGGIVDVLALEVEAGGDLVARGAQRLVAHGGLERGLPLCLWRRSIGGAGRED